MNELEGLRKFEKKVEILFQKQYKFISFNYISSPLLKRKF